MTHREGQHYRMPGLILVAAITIYRDMKHLGRAIGERNRLGLDDSTELVSHISPLGWGHISCSQAGIDG
ncbi:Tn3 family transposase [Tateyamaria sp.]|uniref:Tn3 family transposase n=1 Tax=Tateyamaria sp. TaxID=1929288 RepID=UPI0039B8D357